MCWRPWRQHRRAISARCARARQQEAQRRRGLRRAGRGAATILGPLASARGSGELASACRSVAGTLGGRIGVPGGADGARGAGQCPGHVPRPGRRFWLSCCGVGRSAARARRRGDADAPLERWWSQMRARTGAPTGAAARLVAAAQLERVAGAGVDVGPSLRVWRARLAKRPHARDGDGRRGGWRW